MIYVDSNSFSPQYNFALEYYLAKERPQGDEAVLMLWRTAPTVMIGQFQNIYSEVNLGYAENRGINLVRRLSGGGTIYTDLGTLQFTLIEKQGGDSGFERFARPVLDVVRALGVDAEFSGRNDLTVDGRKFSGNASYTKHGSLVRHGSVLFDCDIDEMERATRIDAAKVESKGIASVRSRVTNLTEHIAREREMNIAEFADMLKAAISRRESGLRLWSDLPDSGAAAEIAELKAREFDDTRAVYAASPKSEVTRKKRFGGGLVEVRVKVEHGAIADIALFGDFFGEVDSAAFAEGMCGAEYTREGVRQALAGVAGAVRICGITPEEIAEVVI